LSVVRRSLLNIRSVETTDKRTADNWQIMLTHLMNLLPQLLRHAGDSEEAREQAVFAAWTAAVGSQVRRVSMPVRLERKTLIIAVPDPTWRTQLTRMRGQALFKVNSLLGSPVVTAIEFVVNPDVIPPQQQSPPEIEFTAPEQQALSLRTSADRIPDAEVRAAFLRAAGKCLDRRAK
jgi:predicted nucleic acid-binding Zn ribbon protein